MLSIGPISPIQNAKKWRGYNGRGNTTKMEMERETEPEGGNPNPNSVPNRQREPSLLVGRRGFFWDLDGRKPGGKVICRILNSFGDRFPESFSTYYSVRDDLEDKDEEYNKKHEDEGDKEHDEDEEEDGHNEEDEDEVVGNELMNAGFMNFWYHPKEKFQPILFDLLRFISRIPPPATIVFVSGKAEFAPYLRKVKGKGYHMVVIGSSKNASSAFRDAGLILYDWGSVINGEGFFPLEEEPGHPSSRKRDYASFSKEEA